MQPRHFLHLLPSCTSYLRSRSCNPAFPWPHLPGGPKGPVESCAWGGRWIDRENLTVMVTVLIWLVEDLLTYFQTPQPTCKKDTRKVSRRGRSSDLPRIRRTFYLLTYLTAHPFKRGVIVERYANHTNMTMVRSMKTMVELSVQRRPQGLLPPASSSRE